VADNYAVGDLRGLLLDLFAPEKSTSAESQARLADLLSQSPLVTLVMTSENRSDPAPMPTATPTPTPLLDLKTNTAAWRLGYKTYAKIDQRGEFILYGERGVTIVHPDGKVEYQGDMTPNEAAKVFWQSVENMRKVARP
jgi:hypothetical protein